MFVFPIELGDTVRQDYETLRQEAREYAIGRNKMLQEATLAYMHGNRATAKALSRQGQQFNAQMKDLHMMVSRDLCWDFFTNSRFKSIVK